MYHPSRDLWQPVLGARTYLMPIGACNPRALHNGFDINFDPDSFAHFHQHRRCSAVSRGLHSAARDPCSPACAFFFLVGLLCLFFFFSEIGACFVTESWLKGVL